MGKMSEGFNRGGLMGGFFGNVHKNSEKSDELERVRQQREQLAGIEGDYVKSNGNIYSRALAQSAADSGGANGDFTAYEGGAAGDPNYDWARVGGDITGGGVDPRVADVIRRIQSENGPQQAAPVAAAEAQSVDPRASLRQDLVSRLVGSVNRMNAMPEAERLAARRGGGMSGMAGMPRVSAPAPTGPAPAVGSIATGQIKS